jgi:hypothetical protein
MMRRNASVLRSKRRRNRSQTTLATFAACFVAASAVASVTFDEWTEIRNPYLAKLAADYATKSAPQVVALGSSRPEGSLEINEFTMRLRESMPHRRLEAFNASTPAGGLVTQEAFLRSLLAAGPVPAMVLVEVDPEFVQSSLGIIDMPRDLRWSNLVEIARTTMFKRVGAKVVENRLFPLYSLRFGVRRLAWNWARERMGLAPVKLDPLERDIPIFFTEAPKPSGEEKMTPALEELQRRQAAKPMPVFKPTAAPDGSLRRMLGMCIERGIPVLMVEAPVCSHSRKSLAPARPAYREYIARMLKEHPAAEYVDLSELIPNAGFRDEHHVNLYGRAVMCRRMAEMVVPQAFASWERRPMEQRLQTATAEARSTTK